MQATDPCKHNMTCRPPILANTPSAKSDCGHPLQDLIHTSLWLSRIRASLARHLWHYFHFWPLVQPLGRGPTVESLWSSCTPPSLGRGRVAPPPPSLQIRHASHRSCKHNTSCKLPVPANITLHASRWSLQT